ncbi:MAG: hypothetical protein QM569_08765 [Acidovorax sp.]|uniref:hypothetical protein n=1 Tax=Acidovorax sp. TaxID=1872122 RepID=UPI0039E71ABE
METRFKLYRGDDLLGHIQLVPELCDFPWYGGVLEPEPAFAPYAPLFQQELQLLAEEKMDEWGQVLGEIEGPGLSLVPVKSGVPISDFLIHINGVEVTWRT